jgi:RNA polymerase sporulation-specific sigma factor
MTSNSSALFSRITQARLGCSDAFGELLTLFRPIVYRIARTYFAPGYEEDDLFQEAVLGFYSAVLDYNAERGSFESFASLCVRRRLFTFVRSATRRKHAILNQAASLDGRLRRDPDLALIDVIPGSEDPNIFELEDAHRALARIFYECSDLERSALKLQISGFTAREIAMECGVNEKSANNAIWRVHNKARRLFAGRAPQ